MFRSMDAKPPRLVSLDVFRGITIVLMIIVNSPGNASTYAWLQHAIWHGCTLADLVFPFFVFIVGVSVGYATSHPTWLRAPVRIKAGQGHAHVHGHYTTLTQRLLAISKRTLIILVLGLFLNAFPHHFDFATLRYFGVLQRIAICYFFSAVLCLTTRVRTQFFIMLGLLMGYWFLMTCWGGSEPFTPAGNVGAFVDRLIFSPAHLYGKVFDPEGFLGTLPAIATALLGNLTGYWLRSQYAEHEKVQGLFSMGILLVMCGGMWGMTFPINKSLWTSSYVLWTGGWALIVLAGCYWLIEIKKLTKWAWPFKVFGVNAITAYMLHVFVLKLQAMILISKPDGTSENLRLFLTEKLFGWTTLANASLLYALSGVLFWFLVMWVLYRRKIFIKV